MKENQRCLTSSWLKTSMFKLFGVFNNFSWHMSMTLLSPIWTTSADMIMKITSYHACHTKQSAWLIRSSLSWKDFMTETVTMSECGITPLADPWNHSFTLQRRWRWWRHEPENSKKKKNQPVKAHCNVWITFKEMYSDVSRGWVSLDVLNSVI